ncbi:MAG: DEAD/DEAH box helicase [Chloroflexi bacterium]|nr:DEAD/DEAH box helicase [Chloroflexota bacterium]
MVDREERLALKARLPRAWPAFFERHGAFTDVQLATIPLVLAGENVIVCAATASGKTEAAVAPLIERHCPPVLIIHPPPAGPAILYLTPTRALANDLAARLAPPLASLGLTLGIRTRDQNSLHPHRPPALLLTTPEALDALLASRAALLTQVRAVVIDEIHLVDGTPRGDHLRVLLNRLRHLRAAAHARGDAPDDALQYVALSATVADPATVAARYFAGARVVHLPARRSLTIEQIDLAPDDAGALRVYLAGFRARGWRKALAFCNSRAEVEAYAAATRADSPFGAAVFVHYSNIEARRRREIEQQFAAAEVAICFASSTLELGVDIGAIDVVLLIGPPGDGAAFVQRIGRGNRRRRAGQVACFARDPLERLLFAALVDDATPAPAGAVCFRPSVAVQQIFSLIKQSPTGAVRLAELTALFAGLLDSAAVAEIVGGLQQRAYLAPGRPGEWRAGAKLNHLYDLQARRHVPLSIYSNIQTTERAIDIRDQHTQQTVAHGDAYWLTQEHLTLEGRPVSITWYDGEALWIAADQRPAPARRLPYRSARPLLSEDLAQRLPPLLGLPADAAPCVPAPDGRWWWFHWLGDRYGRVALDLLRPHIAVRPTRQPGLCLSLPDAPATLPTWSEEQVVRHLHASAHRYESLLELGPYHHLLPLSLRQRTLVEQFDPPRFLAALARRRPVPAPEALADDLIALVTETGTK